MQPPVMIWMTSRSRSSLVSAVFTHHGLYCGKTLVQQITGYTTYENQEIKKIQKQWYQKMTPAKLLTPHDGFTKAIYDETRGVGRWMMKTGVEFFHTYQSFEPYNIFVKRDADAIADSLKSKRPNIDRDLAFEIATKRLDLIDQLHAEYGGVIVDTDEVVSGDRSSLIEAIRHCNVAYNEETMENAIEK